MSSNEFNRAVRLSNALRVQEAQNHEDYEFKSQKTTVYGLLRECHRLSLSIQIEATTSERVSSRDTKSLPYPQHMRIWRHFPEVGEFVWDLLGEEGTFQYRHLFPSPMECDLSLDGAEPVSSAKGVHDFRHQTAHRYVRRVWREIALDQQLWRGWFETASHNLVDQMCFPMSELDFKIERNADNCLLSLAVGRQRIPLYVVQYVAPQFLRANQISECLQNLQNDCRALSTGGQLQNAFLSVLIRAYSHILQHGIWRGIVDTGEALIFLKVSRKNPQILKVYHRSPHEEVSSDTEHDYRRTVVGEYISLALSCLQHSAPTQQWWKAAGQLDGCRVNTLTVSRNRNPLSLNPMLRSSAIESQAPVIKEYACSRFCTAKCLAGLLAGTSLDPSCPNNDDHGEDQHDLDAAQFIEFFQKQIEVPSPYTELQPLYIPGNHNHLLRGTLDKYGYTFLVKVAEHGFEDKLQEELDTFKALAPLQGVCIPICFGLLNIKALGGTPLIYHGMEFEKLLILSWEGVSVPHAASIYGLKSLEEQRTRIRQRFESIGIECPDLAWTNLVWNPQSRRLMLINFKYTRVERS